MWAGRNTLTMQLATWTLKDNGRSVALSITPLLFTNSTRMKESGSSSSSPEIRLTFSLVNTVNTNAAGRSN